MTKKIDKNLKEKPTAPSKKLLESLNEIEDYKKGKIKLETYKDVESLRKTVTIDK